MELLFQGSKFSSTGSSSVLSLLEIDDNRRWNDYLGIRLESSRVIERRSKILKNTDYKNGLVTGSNQNRRYDHGGRVG